MNKKRAFKIGRVFFLFGYCPDGWQINDRKGFYRRVFLMLGSSTHKDYPDVGPLFDFIAWRFSISIGALKS